MNHIPILVVMPLYNAIPYLNQAIESILEQTFRDFEFLIINDGSTDGSEEKVRAYSDRRIILHDQPNSGPGTAMNYAINYALVRDIPFIARMDADDIAHPNRLQKQYDTLQNHPNMAACSANAHYIDSETGKIIGASTVSSSPRLIRWEIFHGLRGLIQGTSMFRTHALHQIGGYRQHFIQAEEVDVFLRLAEQFELINCPDYLYQIRVRANSISMSDTQRNVLYQFYALDCAERRKRHQVERRLEEFAYDPGILNKFQIWREVKLLNFWRQGLGKKNILSILYASILDPRRVIVRFLRKIYT